MKGALSAEEQWKTGRKIAYCLKNELGCTVDYATLVDLNKLKQAAWIRGIVFVPQYAFERVHFERRNYISELEEGLQSGVLALFSGHSMCELLYGDRFQKQDSVGGDEWIDFVSDVVYPIIKGRRSLRKLIQRFPEVEKVLAYKPTTREEWEARDFEWGIHELSIRGILGMKMSNGRDLAGLDSSHRKTFMNCIILAECMESCMPLVCRHTPHKLCPERTLDLLRFSIPDISDYIKELSWDDIRKDSANVMFNSIFKSRKTKEELKENLTWFRDVFPQIYDELASYGRGKRAHEIILGVLDVIEIATSVAGIPFTLPTFLPYLVWKKLRPKIRQKHFALEQKWSSLMYKVDQFFSEHRTKKK